MKTYTEYPENYTYSSCVHRDMYPHTKYRILHIIHVMNKNELCTINVIPNDVGKIDWYQTT